MQPRVWVDQITFSDDTRLNLKSDDVTVIVGPNNCGKSATLRGIRDKFGDPAATSVVVKDISIQREGSVDELCTWLDSTTKRIEQNSRDWIFSAFGQGIWNSQARACWTNSSSPLQALARFFCFLLTADERLAAANPPQNIAIAREAPAHPIHYLLRDDALEQKLSQQFKKAFGSELIVHRNAGSIVPLHVGEKPQIMPGQDRVSLPYVVELERLPAIHTQGDGMRSFCGVLLYTSVGRQTVLLIDEPEAFLHPPQARHLGRMMVSDRKSDRQLFIATHSGDVLRGILDSSSPNIRVIRLRRDGSINVARQLDNDRVGQLWSDPLLRHSDILDGLFHEKVILCESDSDCRFYAAVMDILFEDSQDHGRKPDVMFTHCGGKHRMPLVIESLRQLDVPVATITDFDVLREEQPLQGIVEASCGDWSLVNSDWKTVKTAVDSKKPELSAEEVKNEITKILAEVDESVFSEAAKKRIQTVLRRSSPWSGAKSIGVPFVPNGSPSEACERVLSTMRNWGIFIVPVGELEGFCKTASGKGPKWVNAALKKNLAKDDELEQARKFVRTVIGQDTT